MHLWQLGSAYLITLSKLTEGQSCNPLTSGANVCPPNPGAPRNYFVDFTKRTTLPAEWTLSDSANFQFGSHGAEFTFSKRKDSAQIWTNFYLFFGKVDVVMQAAPGIAMISNIVLMSDDHDEMDWEWSGNNFGNANSQGQVQTNYFGKGVTGWYDRGTTIDIEQPQSRFHTYSLDWTPERIIWSINGQTVRTFQSSEADNGDHQYPQTPAKLQLGIWCGGDSDSDPGVRAWAGGLTDLSKAPYTMYVQSVSITNDNPAAAYNWTDKSGSYESIQKLQNYELPASSSAPRTATTQAIGLCSQLKYGQPSTVAAPTWTVPGTTSTCYTWHVVSQGESCSSVQTEYGISGAEFRSWNPGLDANCYKILTGIAYCVCGSIGSQVSPTSASESSSKSSPLVTIKTTPTADTTTRTNSISKPSSEENTPNSLLSSTRIPSLSSTPKPQSSMSSTSATRTTTSSSPASPSQGESSASLLSSSQTSPFSSVSMTLSSTSPASDSHFSVVSSAKSITPSLSGSMKIESSTNATLTSTGRTSSSSLSSSATSSSNPNQSNLPTSHSTIPSSQPFSSTSKSPSSASELSTSTTSQPSGPTTSPTPSTTIALPLNPLIPNNQDAQEDPYFIPTKTSTSISTSTVYHTITRTSSIPKSTFSSSSSVYPQATKAAEVPQGYDTRYRVAEYLEGLRRWLRALMERFRRGGHYR